MKHTHKNTIIKELDSESLNELNFRLVYQVEFVGKGTYNMRLHGVVTSTKDLNQYLVEYEEGQE